MDSAIAFEIHPTRGYTFSARSDSPAHLNGSRFIDSLSSPLAFSASEGFYVPADTMVIYSKQSSSPIWMPGALPLQLKNKVSPMPALVCDLGGRHMLGRLVFAESGEQQLQFSAYVELALSPPAPSRLQDLGNTAWASADETRWLPLRHHIKIFGDPLGEKDYGAVLSIALPVQDMTDTSLIKGNSPE